MESTDFYSDRKFCTSCNGYVPYLMSVEKSYCAMCGAEVRLFSQADWTAFHESMLQRRPKGGRPRKEAGKDSKKESA